MPDPCAHVGFGFIAARILFWIVPWCSPSTPFDALAVDALIVIASNLPDLCDKPLFLLRLTKGTRAYGHTLLFLVAGSCSAAAAVRQFPLWFSAEPVCVLRVVATAIASHLLADMCFGYVPLFWPLQTFRETSMVNTPYTKPIKRTLDLGALLYVSFCSGLPERIGGWSLYATILVAFLVVTRGAVLVVKTMRHRHQQVQHNRQPTLS
eukprot:TRINITY_DN9536_c0_g1_i3.p1 TRINITY_DN9536_c0_g1~~TRINITY_DN9536_c0_g1_i3.p1  ORF type:complete len:208 (-),score=23.82 TRINITY_DN9536_c0_g1_i3:364-987(-)